MRKNYFDASGWSWYVIIFLMIMACFAGMTSCRILHAHKSKSSSTLDSTHQVINNKGAATKTDSNAHSDKIDSSKKQTWWNWEKQTTTTTQWIPPVQHDTAHQDAPGIWFHPSSGIILQTTTTNERGQQYIQEQNSNREIVDVDLSKLDTSSAQQSQTTQVKKTETNQVQDKKVKAMQTWWCIALLLVCIIVFWLNLSPGQIGWILAIFKRKKPQDKS